MHGRRSLLANLEPIDLELEKTLRTHKHVKNKLEWIYKHHKRGHLRTILVP